MCPKLPTPPTPPTHRKRKAEPSVSKRLAQHPNSAVFAPITELGIPFSARIRIPFSNAPQSHLLDHCDLVTFALMASKTPYSASALAYSALIVQHTRGTVGETFVALLFSSMPPTKPLISPFFSM